MKLLNHNHEKEIFSLKKHQQSLARSHRSTTKPNFLVRHRWTQLGLLFFGIALLTIPFATGNKIVASEAIRQVPPTAQPNSFANTTFPVTSMPVSPAFPALPVANTPFPTFT